MEGPKNVAKGSDCLPNANAVGKQPSIPLHYLGTGWTLNWWWWWWWWTQLIVTGSMNMWICIRHCQELNLQPVSSQAGADPTRCHSDGLAGGLKNWMGSEFGWCSELVRHGRLTLSLPLTRICVNISTVYNDTLVAKGLRYFGHLVWPIGCHRYKWWWRQWQENLGRVWKMTVNIAWVATWISSV